MTPEYKARRAAKHAAQAFGRVPLLPVEGLIDLTVKMPRLTWLGGKTFKQGSGRKNRPGHNTELNEALVENGSRTFATKVDKALSDSTKIRVAESK